MSPRTLHSLVGLALLLGLSLASCDSGGGDDGPAFPVEGDLYPAVTVTDCSGAAVDLSAWIADHDVAFITFGATWCTACKEETPTLNQQLVAGLAAEDVGVAQLLIEDQPGFPPTQALCSAWETELNTDYPVFVDLDQVSVQQHFGGAIQTLPLHFIVTRDGVIRLRKLGELPSDIQQRVRDWLP